MLAVSSYSERHLEHARQMFDAQLDAYAAIAPNPEFDHVFFNHLVLALDRYFVHRLRGAEGKDGNPLNELRIICDSIVDNDSVLAVEKSIKYKPEASCCGILPGSRIALDIESFRRLADGVFDEIRKRFPS